MTLEDIAVMSTKIPQELLISYMQDTSLIYLIAILAGFDISYYFSRTASIRWSNSIE